MGTRLYGNAFTLLDERVRKKDTAAKFDLILADPPYDLTKAQQNVLHTLFLQLCSKTIIIFSPPENQWILPAHEYLFWVKPISTKNTSKHYSRFVEIIFVYHCEGKLVWNTNRHWSQYTNVFMDLVDDSSLHPYRKPPSLIERLILNHTNPGDLILDPFAGSFVVDEVASRLDRRCISIEISHPTLRK